MTQTYKLQCAACGEIKEADVFTIPDGWLVFRYEKEKGGALCPDHQEYL